MPGGFPRINVPARNSRAATFTAHQVENIRISREMPISHSGMSPEPSLSVIPTGEKKGIIDMYLGTVEFGSEIKTVATIMGTQAQMITAAESC